MKLSSFKLACRLSFDSRRCFSHTVFVATFALGCFACGVARAHTSTPGKPATNQKASELETRIAAAAAARDSGNSSAVALANENLIAEALRELAGLRLIDLDYPQAIELYNKSLDFHDEPGTHIDLSFANLRAGHLDEAIRQAEKFRNADAREINADDIRVNRILGSALLARGEYARAVQPLTRIAEEQPTVENLYSLAICLLETKQPEDKQHAVKIFEQMRQNVGESGSLHVLFGRAYRDAEDMPSAIREFHRAVAIDTRTPHAHYFLGLALLSLNEWKPTPESEAEMKTEVEAYPRDYLANYMLGFVTSGERRYEESNKYLATAAEIKPTGPEPFLYMGLNAYAQDDLKRSEAMLRKAVALTGNDEQRSNYQIRRAYVDLGRILSNTGRRDEAEAFLSKARDLQDKTMVESQQNISSIALAGGAGSAAAVMPLSRKHENESAPLVAGDQAPSSLTPEQRATVNEQAKELKSVLGLSFNDLATSEALTGEYRRALSYYQQAEQWDSELAGLQKNLGQCAFRAGDYPEAVRGLSQAIRQQPEATALRAMLGMSYYAMSQYSEASGAFAALGARGMSDGETGYAWADALAHNGDMKKASEVLNAFESGQRPNSTLLLVGQLWTAIGDYGRAVSTFQRALESEPSLLKAHYDSGLAYIRWEHWPEAAREFQAELALVPADPDAEYHLGFVYKQQSKIDEAVALFRKVVDAHPNYANAQYELGKIQLDRGQTKEAVEHLEAAERVSPQTDYLHYQLQAAYRKEDRIADADRELEIYKQLKAKSRERAAEAAKSNSTVPTKPNPPKLNGLN